MNMKKTITLPRLYTDQDLNDSLALDQDQSHYLLNVLRKNNGDHVRIFNGRDGEYTAAIEKISKKAVRLIDLEKIKDQPVQGAQIHLYFPPIRKERLAFLIEKSVELGTTHLHPVVTEHTQHGALNPDKLRKQIIEAAEQCERMDIPVLYDLEKLQNIQLCHPRESGDLEQDGKRSQVRPEITTTNPIVYLALERQEGIYMFAPDPASEYHLMIGPEGGWSHDERNYFFSRPDVFQPVSLGDTILRAETAALFMLSRIRQ